MAIWHFRIGLVPRDSVKAIYGNIPVALPEQEITKHDFWETYQVPVNLESLLSSFGPEINSWSEEMRCWGAEDGHQISVLYQGSRVEWITSKVDARLPCTDFLRQTVSLAVQLNCLLLASETYILEPEFDSLFERFRYSVAARYLADPGGTLKSLPKGNASNTPD
jgi:hypothetical protein